MSKRSREKSPLSENTLINNIVSNESVFFSNKELNDSDVDNFVLIHL